MPASIVVQILITGICAIIPSAADKNLTRVIAPNGMHMPTLPANVPQHFPFIEVHTRNLLSEKGSRQPDFRYHNTADPTGDDRAVFILGSEEITLETAGTNTTKVVNDTPRGDDAHPTALTAAERTTTNYQLNVPAVCNTCGPVLNKYFDVSENGRNDVALRMDLHGGRQSVIQPDFDKKFHFPDTNPSFVPQPAAQEVVFEFDVPAEIERIKLRRFAGDTPSQIALFSNDHQPIQVVVGNAPVHDILNLAANEPQHLRDDHWALMYQMFATPPSPLPIPQRFVAQSAPTHVRGTNDDCVPTEPRPQDPTP
jgi:hypothetical protein